MTHLPQFVVLGQGKAGTSLIYRVLEKHPDIGLSDPKELHYFSAHYDKGHDWYAGHFAQIPKGKIIGEVSPSYLKPDPVQRVADTLGRDTKIIFVLRRPVERAYARYLQNICASQDPGDFEKTARFLTRWADRELAAIRLCYALFRPENILPLFFETDIACAHPSYEAKILAHIGASPHSHIDQLEKARVNPTVMPHYIATGDEALIFYQDGQRFVVPKNRLVFCAQERNSKDVKAPSPALLAQAFYRQSSWSRSVTRDEYAALQCRAVLPAADQLEAEFGFDLTHWRCAPQRIMYDPALPPLRFQKDAPSDV